VLGPGQKSWLFLSLYFQRESEKVSFRKPEFRHGPFLGTLLRAQKGPGPPCEGPGFIYPPINERVFAVASRLSLRYGAAPHPLAHQREAVGQHSLRNHQGHVEEVSGLLLLCTPVGGRLPVLMSPACARNVLIERGS